MRDKIRRVLETYSLIKKYNYPIIIKSRAKNMQLSKHVFNLSKWLYYIMERFLYYIDRHFFLISLISVWLVTLDSYDKVTQASIFKHCEIYLHYLLWYTILGTAIEQKSGKSKKNPHIDARYIEIHVMVETSSI